MRGRLDQREKGKSEVEETENELSNRERRGSEEVERGVREEGGEINGVLRK